MLERALVPLALCLVLSCTDIEWPAPPVVSAPRSSATVVTSAAPGPSGPTRINENPLFSIFERDEEAYASYRKSLSRAPKTLEPRTEGSSLTAVAVTETSRAEARDVEAPPQLYGLRLEEGERGRVVLVVTGKERCFTAVAHGGLGVMEVDAFIVEGPDSTPEVVGEDSKRGPIAVVGGLAGCGPNAHDCGPICIDEKSEAPRVEVVVRRGAGPVVVGVSRRAG